MLTVSWEKVTLQFLQNPVSAKNAMLTISAAEKKINTRGQFMALGVECHNSCFSRNIAGIIHNVHIKRT